MIIDRMNNKNDSHFLQLDTIFGIITSHMLIKEFKGS
jgi:hypothetical protein